MDRGELERLIEQYPYERYWYVNLPYGLHTRGINRIETRNAIFQQSLSGKSFLDIGSAYGYFCFEAEQLGAYPIMGTEVKPERLERANLFKKVLSSRVGFVRNDVRDLDIPGGKFDFVIILNVLHHMTHLRYHILDYLVERKVNETLVIESPALQGESLDLVLRRYEGGLKELEIFPSSLDGPEKGVRLTAICRLR